jgi:hypothetical protein
MSNLIQAADQQDVALASADKTRGQPPELRRRALQIALTENGLKIAESQHVSAAIDKAGDADYLAKAVVSWWSEHKYNRIGANGERNAYNETPQFIELAKRIIGE